MSTLPRLNRLFANDGKCFDVAIDHGFFGEWDLLSGIEDLQKIIRIVVDAAPDAIQLSPGQALLLQEIPGKAKPALVLRTDVANVYGSELPRQLWSRLIDEAVEQALRLDAACVVVNLFLAPEQPDLYRQCIDNVNRLKPVCERYGMPLMVETLALRPGTSGGYGVDGDVKKIVSLVRQAVELGADVIKADPTDDPEEYGQVIQAAGRVPVLVRGGGKAPEQEIFERTVRLMQQGARGIVYGRNVFQRPNPKAMTRALMAIVHEGATAEQALAIARQND